MMFDNNGDSGPPWGVPSSVDHVILVGEVVRYDVRGGVSLVFHDGRYIASAVEEPLPDALKTPWR